MEGIVLFLKIAFLVLDKWMEKDKIKQKQKTKLLEEIKRAKTIPDKKARASRLNSLVERANRL